MAAKPGVKTEAKAGTKAKTSTDGKSEAKTAAKDAAKDATATDAGSGNEDAGSGNEKESSTSGAPTEYNRGENQKLVTNAYRNHWNDVFGKMPRCRQKK